MRASASVAARREGTRRGDKRGVTLSVKPHFKSATASLMAACGSSMVRAIWRARLCSVPAWQQIEAAISSSVKYSQSCHAANVIWRRRRPSRLAMPLHFSSGDDGACAGGVILPLYRLFVGCCHQHGSWRTGTIADGFAQAS